MEKGLEYTPLVLAYMGDAVYEVYIRRRLINMFHIPIGQIHRKATQYVCAEAQYRAMHALEPLLSEEEIHVFKKGRNAKSATVPKNADVTHYRHATGFESLIGWLYVTDNKERLCYILDASFDALKED